MSEMANGNSSSLADRLLGDMKESGRPLSLYLVNGFQMKGEIVDYDHATILIKLKDAHQLVMRPAVASMYPLGSADSGAGWWLAYSSADSS